MKTDTTTKKPETAKVKPLVAEPKDIVTIEKASNAELVANIKKSLKMIVTIKRNIMKDIKDINVNQLAEDCASLELNATNVSNLSQILKQNVSNIINPTKSI